MKRRAALIATMMTLIAFGAILSPERAPGAMFLFPERAVSKLEAEKDFNAAAALIDEYLRDNAADRRAQRRRAQNLANAGRLDESIGAWRELLRGDNGDDAALSGLAFALGRDLKFNEAIDKFIEYLDRRPDATAERVGLGNAYLGAGLPYKAIEQYRLVVRRGITRDHVELQLARAYLQTGNLRQARRYVDRTLRREPESPLANHLASRLLLYHFETQYEFENGKKDEAFALNSTLEGVLTDNSSFRFGMNFPHRQGQTDHRFTGELSARLNSRIKARAGVGVTLRPFVAPGRTYSAGYSVMFSPRAIADFDVERMNFRTGAAYVLHSRVQMHARRNWFAAWDMYHSRTSGGPDVDTGRFAIHRGFARQNEFSAGAAYGGEAFHPSSIEALKIRDSLTLFTSIQMWTAPNSGVIISLSHINRRGNENAGIITTGIFKDF